RQGRTVSRRGGQRRRHALFRPQYAQGEPQRPHRHPGPGGRPLPLHRRRPGNGPFADPLPGRSFRGRCESRPSRGPGPDPRQQRQALLDTQSRMNSMGVTAVRNALSSVAVYRRWQALRDEGAISLRNAFLIGGLGTAAAVENFVATSGVQPNEGDDWLRLVGLKFISDGGFEGGLMRDPYNDPYGH